MLPVCEGARVKKRSKSLALTAEVALKRFCCTYGGVCV